ncbi:7tm 6 domain containing protein, partial [Asbolus verrucosus]
MEKYDWKQPIKSTILKLKILGMWPEGNGSYKCNLYTVWSIFVIIFFTCGHAFFQTFNLVFVINDLKAILSTIYVTLSEVLIVLKAVLVVKNIKMLKQLIFTLNSDLFQPRNDRQLNLIKPDVLFLNKNTFTYSTAVWATVFFWSTYPIFDKSYKNWRLPFLAWYPYNTNVSPYYELTYIYQVISVSFHGCNAITVDTLIAVLHLYIGTQFDILCDDISHLYDPTEEGSTDFNQKLINCVQHHREILKFYEASSHFSNWIVFLQFFISATSIGITMFQLTTVTLFSSQFFAFVFFLIAISAQIFLFCWFGNEVESSKIPYAVFKSNWTETPMMIKKHLLIFVERTQRPLKVMAMDLFFLNLETYMKYDWKETISTTIVRLKILGLWPEGDETYQSNLYTLWSIFCITLFTFGHPFFQTINIIFIFDDLEAVVATIYVTLSEILIVLKAYLTIKNMKTLKQLMVTLNSDLFQPRNAKQFDLFQPGLKFWKVNSFLYWTMASGAVFFWSTYPIFDNSMKDYRLPFLAWYPYNTKVSPYYEITYIHQAIGVIPFSSEFFSLLSYLLAITVEIFTYCWFGNEVEVKSSKLAYAVFESQW